MNTHKYHNISYPKILDNEQSHKLFKDIFCTQGFHLFDEVLSMDSHTLYCDACGLTVYIDRIVEEPI